MAAKKKAVGLKKSVTPKMGWLLVVLAALAALAITYWAYTSL